jgi:hypothetical protein
MGSPLSLPLPSRRKEIKKWIRGENEKWTKKMWIVEESRREEDFFFSQVKWEQITLAICEFCFVLHQKSGHKIDGCKFNMEIKPTI